MNLDFEGIGHRGESRSRCRGWLPPGIPLSIIKLRSRLRERPADRRTGVPSSGTVRPTLHPQWPLLLRSSRC